MSTLTRPRGPLPPRVYWTRRLVLLAVVFLLSWLVVRAVGGGGSEAPPSGSEEPVAATASDDGGRASNSSGRKSRDKDRRARIRTVAETFEHPRENCDLTRVSVTPAVADPAYAGEPAVIALRISTSGSTPCSLSIDADHLLLSITSGHDTVWDSTHCEDAIPTRDLALQPRWSALVDVTWSGRYSGHRCPSDGTPAEPGTYTVEAAVLEGEPADADFELVKRPDPVDEDEGTGDDTSDDGGTSSDGGSDDGGGDSDKPSDDNSTGDDSTGGDSTGTDSAGNGGDDSSSGQASDA
jgi:hypothetical protein